MNENNTQWWGTHNLDVGQTHLWKIGPLELWIEHLSREWNLSSRNSRNWLESSVLLSKQSPRPKNLNSSLVYQPQEQQFSVSAGHQQYTLSPVLAPRNILSRFETPIQILPNEEVSLYLANPLYLKIDLTSQISLAEIASYRLTDSWYGPMNSSGELCLANPNNSYLSLAQVPVRQHLVLSALQVRNSTREKWSLDRLLIPMPRLALYYSPQSGFWTNSLSIEKRLGDADGHLRIESQPPKEAAPAQALTQPRIAGESSLMVRAVNNFMTGVR